jgi:hypothetical protein
LVVASKGACVAGAFDVREGGLGLFAAGASALLEKASEGLA